MGTSKSNNGLAHYRRPSADVNTAQSKSGMRPTYGYNRSKPMNQFANRKRGK